MSVQSHHNVIVEFRKDIDEILKLAWDLECGISWYDVEDSKDKLEQFRNKYQVEPFTQEEYKKRSS